MTQEKNPAASSYPQAFLQAVAEAIAGLGWEVARWEEGAVVCKDSEGGESSYGLDNLYRRVRNMDPTDWQEFIADHLGRIHAGTSRARATDDLYSVAHRILLRIGQPFTEKRTADMVWWTPLADGQLIATLVVDHPDTMSYVTKNMVEESHRAGDEWFEVALDNLRSRTSPEMLEAIGDDTGILICCTGDAYDAARSLVLDHLLPEAQYGALVAMPNRDRLLVMPVRPETILKLHLVKLVAAQSFAEAPYPISEDVYWIREENWVRIPIEFREGTLSITAPEEFAELLNEITGKEDEE